ncbi:hypothetical protein SAMN05421640_0972 [Ekhidna lutea]|uniref:Uncharacterized protein n=1 Tax=Ekhidna lutea TaxID=447679 RepID=A0A239GR05_EKHLU|nr:hypothetical protein [Ekhidna lutea]SNS71656.1 hypothetical protein SAMN05421640_0972 [Ekhidna lutea]
MANTKWKDYLLKSGVPLEFEIKKLLDELGCQTRFDQSYLRNDRNQISTEFSYDIDSSYIKDLFFFKLLIECKYRDPSTNWLFVPDNEQSGKTKSYDSFLHPIDFFTLENKFYLDYYLMPYFSPSCEKGIEITSDRQNPKSITQAANQLSYGLVHEIIESMIVNYESDDGLEDQLCFHIPIIVTTANLYVAKKDLTIDSLKKSEKIEQIAKKENSLVLKYNIGKELEQYNFEQLKRFTKRYSIKDLKKRFNCQYDDLDLTIRYLSKHACPRSILVMHYDQFNNSFTELFELFNLITSPNKSILRLVRDKDLKKELKNKYGIQ